MARPNRSRIELLISVFLFVSLVASIVFTVIRISTAPSVPGDSVDAKGKTDYVLMLVQCTLGLVVMLFPSVIEKRLNLHIPSIMMILYLLFLYAAIYLGEVQNFYYQIPHWDIILHTFSGFMLGCLSFSFITLLNKWDKMSMNLRPIFVAVFAFCFTITLGVFWEVYEYTLDGIMGLNMQKFITADGTVLIGRAALADTMEDLIVDGLGALGASIVGYVSLKYNKGWIERFQIRKQKTIAK